MPVLHESISVRALHEILHQLSPEKGEKGNYEDVHAYEDPDVVCEHPADELHRSLREAVGQ